MKERKIYGPLSVLRNLFNEKKRIRVLIRGKKKVKCQISGYVKAFDKHCNMILFDVYKAKSLEFRPKSSSRRYMKQLFIRGENVAVVSADPCSSSLS